MDADVSMIQKQIAFRLVAAAYIQSYIMCPIFPDLLSQNRLQRRDQPPLTESCSV